MADPAADDRKTIDEVLAGNSRAYSRIVDRYRDRALTLAVRMVGDRRDAEEIVQDAFVRAFRSLERFRGEAAFGTWYYRILYNVCLSHLGRVKGQPRHLIIDEDIRPDNVPSDPDDLSFMERIEDDELREFVDREIPLLPERYRTAILLFYIEGMSYEDMCTVLQVPLGTVKTYLFRGRILLRERVLRRIGKEVESS
jgi:RNA polymerase sigma-70 factor (ECF subfamily)